MMRKEFEDLLGKSVADPVYKEIEYVYTWHPAIDDVKGKQQIVDLFKIGGIGVIRDMMNTATINQAIEAEMQDAERKVRWLRDRRERVKEGDMSYENMMRDVEETYAGRGCVADFEEDLKNLQFTYGESEVAEIVRMRRL